ncbi:MAG: MgtC/SapB family protein [Candidatus Aminicenantes bacterium]|nr:MgtC/SapB family protein [Candidatus Aminicenantes bacterium]
MEIEIILKILLSALLGGIVGLEREISHREAGLRANILIAVGSTLITVIALKLTENASTANPTGMIAQIIIAIGVIGAGVIIRSKFEEQGLTTAATIWTVAAIGIGVGSGYYLISLLVSIFVVIILTISKYITKIIENQKKLYAYIIKTEDKAAIIIEMRKIIKELGIRYIKAKLGKIKDGFEIDVLLSTSENKNKEFVEKVMQLQGVIEIDSENL